MKVGEYDNRVIIQTLTETNNQGELTQAWATLATVWAKVVSEKGSDAFQSARLNAVATIRVGMRYRSDVDVSARLTWDGQQYSITSVDRSQQRKGELWLSAQAVGAL